MRAPHLHDTLRRFCLGAFAVFTRDLEDGTDLPFAFEEHGTYGRPTLYEYRPLVRGFVEARAERLFARVDVQDAVADLCASRRRASSRTRTRGRRRRAARGLPQRARAAPRPHRRGLRRLRLGRLRLRARVRGARGLAVRRGPLVRRGRAARSASRSARRSSSATGSACAWPPRASSRRCGRRRRGCCRGTSAASRTGSACSSSSARSPGGPTRRRTRPASSPMRSRRSGSPPRHRSPPARCCSSGSTGGRTGSVPCYRSQRPRRRANPRGSIPSARRSRATCGSASRIADDDARLGDALDRWELALFQTEPFRGDQLRHALEGRSGRATEPGPPRCAAPPCSARRLGSAPTSRRSCASRALSSCAASSSRSSCTATAARWCATSMRRCSASRARSQASSSAPAS